MKHTVMVLVSAVVVSLSAVAVWADEGPNQGVADPISLDRQSPSVLTFGNLPADIYGEALWGMPPGQGWDNPGAVAPGPGPIMHVAAPTYGLTPLDNVDAHSNGELSANLTPILYFSVDDQSIGAPGTEVAWQSGLIQAAGDRFVTNGMATVSPQAVMQGGALPATVAGPVIPGRPSINLLSLNQDWYYEIPSVRPNVLNPYVPAAGATAMDDMDALELTPFDINGDQVHDTAIYFSLDVLSPTLNNFAASPADILFAPPAGVVGGVFATAATMGLSTTDDIDALAVFDAGNDLQVLPGADFALFSLAPGSPALAGGPFSPADIFVTDFTGVFMLYMSAASLGLLPTDNVDALDVEFPPNGLPEVFEVPEPMSMTLLGLGLAGLLYRRRKG